MPKFSARRTSATALVLIALTTLTACGGNNEASSSESSAAPTWAGATAPSDIQLDDFKSYEKTDDIQKAVADLSDTELINYYHVLCAGHSLATKEEILNFTVRADLNSDVQAAYDYVNDAPDIVRQISDRNKELLSSPDATDRPSVVTDSRCLDSKIIKKAKAKVNESTSSASAKATATATSTKK